MRTKRMILDNGKIDLGDESKFIAKNNHMIIDRQSRTRVKILI